ncbi:hypothetical protein M8J75_015027 [Diaphorina citri]|nr:hypothetical protein M8J75_015027 [Diaphorina citri]
MGHDRGRRSSSFLFACYLLLSPLGAQGYIDNMGKEYGVPYTLNKYVTAQSKQSWIMDLTLPYLLRDSNYTFMPYILRSPPATVLPKEDTPPLPTVGHAHLNKKLQEALGKVQKDAKEQLFTKSYTMPKFYRVTDAEGKIPRDSIPSPRATTTGRKMLKLPVRPFPSTPADDPANLGQIEQKGNYQPKMQPRLWKGMLCERTEKNKTLINGISDSFDPDYDLMNETHPFPNALMSDGGAYDSEIPMLEKRSMCPNIMFVTLGPGEHPVNNPAFMDSDFNIHHLPANENPRKYFNITLEDNVESRMDPQDALKRAEYWRDVINKTKAQHAHMNEYNRDWFDLNNAIDRKRRSVDNLTRAEEAGPDENIGNVENERRRRAVNGNARSVVRGGRRGRRNAPAQRADLTGAEAKVSGNRGKRHAPAQRNLAGAEANDVKRGARTRRENRDLVDVEGIDKFINGHPPKDQAEAGQPVREIETGKGALKEAPEEPLNPNVVGKPGEPSRKGSEPSRKDCQPKQDLPEPDEFISIQANLGGHSDSHSHHQPETPRQPIDFLGFVQPKEDPNQVAVDDHGMPEGHHEHPQPETNQEEDVHKVEQPEKVEENHKGESEKVEEAQKVEESGKVQEAPKGPVPQEPTNNPEVHQPRRDYIAEGIQAREGVENAQPTATADRQPPSVAEGLRVREGLENPQPTAKAPVHEPHSEETAFHGYAEHEVYPGAFDECVEEDSIVTRRVNGMIYEYGGHKHTTPAPQKEGLGPEDATIPQRPRMRGHLNDAGIYEAVRLTQLRKEYKEGCECGLRTEKTTRDFLDAGSQVNKIKYQIGELKKRYKTSEELQKRREARERIQIIRETFDKKLKTLKAVDPVDKQSEEMVGKEWYNKNKVKRSVEPSAAVKSRKKRSTYVMYKKNNQTFVVKTKYLNLLRRKNVKIYLNHEAIRKFDSRRRRRHVADRIDDGFDSENEFDGNVHGQHAGFGDREGVKKEVSEGEDIKGNDPEENLNRKDTDDAKDIGGIDAKDDEKDINGNVKYLGKVVHDGHLIYLDSEDLEVRNADSQFDGVELRPEDIVDSHFEDPREENTEDEQFGTVTTNNAAPVVMDRVPNNNTEKGNINTKSTETPNVDTKDTITSGKETDTLNNDVKSINLQGAKSTDIKDTKSSNTQDVTTPNIAQDMDAAYNLVNSGLHGPRAKREADLYYVTKPKGGWKRHIKRKLAEVKKKLSTKFKDRIYEWTTKHKWETLPDEKDRTTPTLMKKKFLNIKKIRQMI